MKKIFLAASFAEVAPLFAEYAKPLALKRITFIPTASLVETVTFYVAAAKKAFAALGMHIDMLDIATASAHDIRAKLQGNDAIYISGGNTFFLLQALQKSGADNIIIEQVAAGKIYIGESAGAIVAAPDIEYVKTMDDLNQAPELKDFTGLRLIDAYPLPHYGNAPFTHITRRILAQYGGQLPIQPISNHQALCWENGQLTLQSHAPSAS